MMHSERKSKIPLLVKVMDNECEKPSKLLLVSLEEIAAFTVHVTHFISDIQSLNLHVLLVQNI